MSSYSPSRRLRSRMFSSIIMLVIIGVIFRFYTNVVYIIIYAAMAAIYLAIMIPRYRKVKRVEEAVKRGDFSQGVPRINPAANKYPSGFGQPPSYMPSQSQNNDVTKTDLYNQSTKEICANCGSVLAFDARFCEECGARRD